jgi:hypothetical protein
MINGIGAMAPLTGQSHERLIRSDQYESDLVLAAVHDVGIDTLRPTGCSPTFFATKSYDLQHRTS